MRELELLAPARNADIGIAAIDCGADAVYIAGPRFGARQAAGNSIEDIAGLCRYAHRFGARIFVTLNTIIYDGELARAYESVSDAGEIQELLRRDYDKQRLELLSLREEKERSGLLGGLETDLPHDACEGVSFKWRVFWVFP